MDAVRTSEKGHCRRTCEEKRVLIQYSTPTLVLISRLIDSCIEGVTSTGTFFSFASDLYLLKVLTQFIFQLCEGHATIYELISDLVCWRGMQRHMWHFLFSSTIKRHNLNMCNLGQFWPMPRWCWQEFAVNFLLLIKIHMKTFNIFSEREQMWAVPLGFSSVCWAVEEMYFPLIKLLEAVCNFCYCFVSINGRMALNKLCDFIQTMSKFHSNTSLSYTLASSL